MRQNINISRIDKKNKLLNKFLLKRFQMFFIFWTSVSNVLNVHKMLGRQTNAYGTYFYADSTISSILQA